MTFWEYGVLINYNHDVFVKMKKRSRRKFWKFEVAKRQNWQSQDIKTRAPWTSISMTWYPQMGRYPQLLMKKCSPQGNMENYTVRYPQIFGGECLPWRTGHIWHIGQNWTKSDIFAKLDLSGNLEKCGTSGKIWGNLSRIWQYMVSAPPPKIMGGLDNFFPDYLGGTL